MGRLQASAKSIAMPPKKAAASGGGASKGKGKAGADEQAQRPYSSLDLPDLPAGVLPPEVELARTRVICGPDFNSNVRVALVTTSCAQYVCRKAADVSQPPPCRAQTEDFASSHSFMAAGIDNSFDLDDFKRGFSIEVVSLGASTRGVG